MSRLQSGISIDKWATSIEVRVEVVKASLDLAVKYPNAKECLYDEKSLLCMCKPYSAGAELVLEKNSDIAILSNSMMVKSKFSQPAQPRWTA